jgi:hypothetical protein
MTPAARVPHGLPAARALVVALVVAGSGCATHRDAPANDSSVTGTLLGLALFPVVVAASIILAPVAIVALAVEKSNKKPPESWTYGSRFTYIGPVAASDFSPAGILLVAKNGGQPAVDGDTLGTLVVNVGAPSDDARASIETDIAVTCPAGPVKFLARRIYDDLNTSGKILASEPSSAGMAPGPQLDFAIQEMCGTSAASEFGISSDSAFANPGANVDEPPKSNDRRPVGDLINCVSHGKRQWVDSTKCD